MLPLTRTFRLSIFLLPFLMMLSCGPVKTPADPADVGEEIFNILKDFGRHSLESYSAEFVSYEELMEMAEDPEIVTEMEVSDALMKTKAADLRSKRQQEFQGITGFGKQNDIDWSKITFQKFEHELNTDNGGKICVGSTFFQSGDQTFFVQSFSIFNGRGYRLYNISGMNKQ